MQPLSNACRVSAPGNLSKLLSPLSSGITYDIDEERAVFGRGSLDIRRNPPCRISVRVHLLPSRKQLESTPCTQEDTLELESLKNSTHFSSSNILDGRFKVGLKTFVLVAFAASWLLVWLRSIRCPESEYADHEPVGFRLVAALLFFESSVNHP